MSCHSSGQKTATKSTRPFVLSLLSLSEKGRVDHAQKQTSWPMQVEGLYLPQHWFNRESWTDWAIAHSLTMQHYALFSIPSPCVASSFSSWTNRRSGPLVTSNFYWSMLRDEIWVFGRKYDLLLFGFLNQLKARRGSTATIRRSLEKHHWWYSAGLLTLTFHTRSWPTLSTLWLIGWMQL